ncbi:helix-turn-helix domain-containing protein [Anaerovorax sp. IOR16]|uniref:helix-turn-helix domain-containing protein n=1 Tax=Anaerovorax sp. IOR16 TaxID=2773458 RepID=UPI0019D1D8F8|nr:helix-turn-helix transcriptional regulator [Anaerovorax sp. IOR16]
MGDLNTRIFNTLVNKKLKAKDMAAFIGTTEGVVSAWKKRGTDPKAIYVKKIAEFLEVSEDYLLTGKENTRTISGKEKIDIAKEVSLLLDGLNADNSLMFDGEEIDDTTRVLLEKSLQSTLETARIIAKEKYTPKKFKK